MAARVSGCVDQSMFIIFFDRKHAVKSPKFCLKVILTFEDHSVKIANLEDPFWKEILDI